MNTDNLLPLPEKLLLIEEIEQKQKERWERLKVFRTLDTPNSVNRHFLSQRAIDLLRSQKERLLNLKQQILQ